MGPVMMKFIIALREVATYKDVLRSQVEHMLNDRLLHYVQVDLHDVKEMRKRFEKASITYDQAREKFLSLRKSTKMDVAAVIEEELRHARSQYEQARFNLVSALSRVEAKKKFEFLEAVTGTMDAHFRFFKQGYELLLQIQPFINQVLSYAQQSREISNCEQASLNERMEEYRKKIDLECRPSVSGSPRGDGVQPFSRNSHKVIEAVMQSTEKGKVQIIRQGYLSKRSSNLRGDWKRRFFVLDSRGMLYYYRKQCSWSSGGGSQSYVHRSNSPDNGSGLLSRWLSSHYHGGVHDEKSSPRHTVNLLTSTIKVDADQSDLRFCFRIISPLKNYTLQAENAIDQMEWIDKITGVIASLLCSHSPEKRPSTSPFGSGYHRFVSESSSLASSPEVVSATVEDGTSKNNSSIDHMYYRNTQQEYNVKNEKPINVLRRVCGNDKCADCGAGEPDWASLNLGVLICIECSGVHRNLGVQISKVRSLTLDVKVWDASVISLFQSIGNIYANSVWEELLYLRSTYHVDDVPVSFSESDTRTHFRVRKPRHDDSVQIKEMFIHAKYAEKLFVRKTNENQDLLTMAQQVYTNDKKAVYRQIVNSDSVVNGIKRQAAFNKFSGKLSSRYLNTSNKGENKLSEEYPDGCSLLHLACQTADNGMVELLLQYGANVNAPDSRGRTPLHYCILKQRHTIAKHLLSRGADPQAVDREGITPLQLMSESASQDKDILALIGDTRR